MPLNNRATGYTAGGRASSRAAIVVLPNNSRLGKPPLEKLQNLASRQLSGGNLPAGLRDGMNDLTADHKVILDLVIEPRPKMDQVRTRQALCRVLEFLHRAQGIIR